MAYQEAPRATWDKRYKQQHFGYRDFHQVNTVVYAAGNLDPAYLAAVAAAAPAVYYLFGTNARNVAADPLLTINNWPQLNDQIGTAVHPLTGVALTRLLSSYARNVLVNCDQNCWVRFVSLNPDYIKLLTQGLTAAQLAAMGVPQVMTEIEHYIPANAYIRFFPTLGVAIIFRADTVVGTLNIWISGNVEGTE